MSTKTETMFGRVKRAAYETQQGHTEITVTIPGKHHPQPGERIAITLKEGTK